MLGRLARGLPVTYGLAASALGLAGLRFGDSGWLLWAANSSAFWWLAPALGGLVDGARRGRPLQVLACAGASARWLQLFGAALRPLRPGGARDPAGQSTVRVASLNVRFDSEPLDQIRDLVAREHPDVLLLQEVLPALAERLPAALPTLPHQRCGQPRRNDRIGDLVCVLSRFPVIAVGQVDATPTEGRPAVIVTLDVEGVAVAVVPVHLLAPLERGSLWHLRRLDAEPGIRRREITAVLAALAPGPALIGGDFNATHANDPRRLLLAAGFVDAQAAAGFGPGFTWGPGRGLFRLDWLFMRGLEPVRAWVGPAGASDHRPVLTDLVLPAHSDGVPPARWNTSRQNASAARS